MRDVHDPNAITRPWTYLVAEGNRKGATSWSKMGYNLALSSSWEDLWNPGGVYVWPTGTFQASLVSSSTNDSATGSGVRSVVARYLDGDGVQHDETFALTGTVAVLGTATDVFRINNLRAVTCGATGFATGSVTLTGSGAAVVYSQIAAGENRARQIMYTVPTGYILCINRVELAAGAAVAGRAVRFQTQATYNSITGSRTDFFMTYTEKFLQDTPYLLPLDFPTRFPALTDIKVRAISADGATYGNCSLRGWLEETE